MNIVVAGAGEVGTFLTKMLCDGQHNIIVIDTDEEKLSMIDANLDVLTVKGSATSIRVLKSANIAKADLYIAITELEELNITSAILAKHLGAGLTISRVNNTEYIEEENQQYFHSLGIDHLIYPEILGAKEVVSLIRQSGTTKVFDFSGGKLSLVALRLEAGTPIIGKSLRDASTENSGFDYRVVAIIRGGKTIIPTGDDYFRVGDMAYVITTPQGMPNLYKYSGKQQLSVRNIMILGGSRIGKKIAIELEKHLNIKLLEINADKCRQLADELNNTLILNTNGRDIDVMQEEGISKMDVFVAVTGNSETNILSCIFAQKHGVRKTIAEIENLDYIALAENMGIDTIINKKRIAASRIFSFAMNYQKVDVQVELLNGTDAEILDFIVPEGAKVTKRKIRKLKFPNGAIIGGLIRGSKGVIVTGDMQIEADDHVIVFAQPHAIDKAASFFV